MPKTRHHVSAFMSEVDTIPTSDKHRVTGFIPEQDFKEIFEQELTFHGAQSRVLSSLLIAFIDEFRDRRTSTPDISPINIATELLNNIHFNSCP